MSPCCQTIGINYLFGPDDLGNRVFDPARTDGGAVFVRAFRAYVRQRGVEAVTLDMVDPRDPSVSHVLYFDHSWRQALTDSYIGRFPRARRALAIIEPRPVNPSIYYVSVLRDRFATVFTYDLDLLRRHPDYVAINVLEGADPRVYPSNPFGGIAFAEKRLLVAVATNRWSYMPQSTFNLRRRLYGYFDVALAGQFDLFGGGWNAPRIWYERVLGHPRLRAWRGPIAGGAAEKVATMARYRFALCIENNATQAGYISEKIIDCFCARCVPVYYGWRGSDTRIPRDTFLDLRDFRDPAELARTLRGMTAEEHAAYIGRIDRFMASDAIRGFTTERVFQIIADRLSLPPAARALDGGAP